MRPAFCLLGFSVDEDDADFNSKVHFPVWSISCLPCHWRGPAMFSDPYKDHTSSSLASTAVPMVSTMLVSALLPAVVSGEGAESTSEYGRPQALCRYVANPANLWCLHRGRRTGWQSVKPCIKV